MLETLMRRVKRAEDENNYLREAVNGNFSNGKRVEEKVDTERAMINNLLEKMNNMGKKNEERMTKLMRDHKAELKRASPNDDDSGSSRGGYQGGNSGGGGYQGGGNYSGVGKREHKRPSTTKPGAEERRARIEANWEEKIADKLDKSGSGWANTREWHDPDTIN